MSYSRWIGSRWYTFWTVHSGDTLEAQVFDIDCVTKATYAELKTDFEGTLDRVIKDVVDSGSAEATAEERTELAGYMKSFMREMEAGIWKKEEED